MLEVKHLRRVYKVKNGSSVYALDDVSLKFPETGLVFILGKSGSGKSTLLNVMGGLDKADDGEIIINGKSSKEFSGSEMDSYRNTYLGFIFQEYNILNDFTVKENIGLALQLQHKKSTDEEIDRILDEVDLKGYGKRKPNELSGGQKQRVAIARALVKEPKIIFGDEPTGALDSNTGKQVFETLKKLSKEKLVVIVSHDRDFAEHFGDRVIELKDGKVISDITKESIPSKEARQGVTILGNNVIRIEKGHVINSEDLVLINQALEKQDSDTYITADEHVNDAILEAAKIDKSGNRQEFVATDFSKIKDSDEKFHVIKSKFSLHNAIKMGARSLRVKPFRLVMTIFLSAMSFTLFGASVTLGLFNTAQAMTDSATAHQIHTSFFRYTQKEEKSNSNELTQEEKANLESLGAKIYTLDNASLELGSSIPYNTALSYQNYSQNNYYSKYFNRGLIVDSTFLNETGYSLVEGSLPQAEDEIALSMHAIETFIDFGFMDCLDPNYKFEASDNINPNMLLNHYLSGRDDQTGESIYYRLTGIIDTKFNNDLYSQYRKATTIPDWSDSTYNALSSESNDSIHSTLFFSPNRQAKSEDILSYNYLSYHDFNGVEYSVNYGYLKSHTHNLFFEEGKTSLNNKEALVSPYIYFSLLADGKYNSDQRSYSPDGVYFDMDGNNPYIIYFNTRSEVYDYSLGECALYHLSREGYLSFKDQEIFKIYYENQRRDLYGDYYDNYRFRDPNNYDQFLYPWESDPTYELNYDEKLELYNCMMSYLRTIKDNNLSNAPYYAELMEDIESLKEDFDQKCPFTPMELQDTFNRSTDKIYSQFLDSKSQEMYDKYKDNPIYKGIYESVKTDDSSRERETLQTLLSRRLFKPVLKEYLDFMEQKITPIIKDTLKLAPLKKKVFQYYSGNDLVNVEMDIVGFDLESLLDYSNRFCLNKETTEELDKKGKNYYYKDYTYLMILPKEANQIEKVFHYTSSKTKEYNSYDYGKQPVGSCYYSFNDRQLSSVESLSFTLSIMTSVFLYVGLGLAIFSMFLFYNFISISINNKKREIGILRAVGAKRGDVFKIFYSESFIIALINFILSVAATIALSIILNMNFQQNANVSFAIMKPSLITYGLLLAISLFTSILAALIPVVRLANKKPIDAIQNR